MRQLGEFTKTSRSSRGRAKVEDREEGLAGIFKKLALSRHRRFPGYRVAV